MPGEDYLNNIYTQLRSDGRLKKYNTYQDFTNYLSANEKELDHLHKYLNDNEYKVSPIDQFKIKAGESLANGQKKKTNGTVTGTGSAELGNGSSVLPTEETTTEPGIEGPPVTESNIPTSPLDPLKSTKVEKPIGLHEAIQNLAKPDPNVPQEMVRSGVGQPVEDTAAGTGFKFNTGEQKEIQPVERGIDLHEANVGEIKNEFTEGEKQLVLKNKNERILGAEEQLKSSDPEVVKQGQRVKDELDQNKFALYDLEYPGNEPEIYDTPEQVATHYLSYALGSIPGEAENEDPLDNKNVPNVKAAQDFIKSGKTYADLDPLQQYKLLEAGMRMIPRDMYAKFFPYEALKRGIDVTPEDLHNWEAANGKQVDQGMLRNLMNGFLNDMITGVGATVKTAELLSIKTGQALGLKAENLGWGDSIMQTSKDLFPDNPELEHLFVTQLFKAAGSAVPLVAGGIVGTALKVPLWASVGGLGALQGGSAEYDKAIAAGATEAQASLAMLSGMAGGATEVLPFFRFMGVMNKVTGGGFMKNVLKKGGHMALGGLEETAQEQFQTWMSDVTAKELYDSSKEIMGDVTFNSLTVPFVLGMVMSGPSAIRNKEVEPDQAELMKEATENLLIVGNRIPKKLYDVSHPESKLPEDSPLNDYNIIKTGELEGISTDGFVYEKDGELFVHEGEDNLIEATPEQREKIIEKLKATPPPTSKEIDELTTPKEEVKPVEEIIPEEKVEPPVEGEVVQQEEIIPETPAEELPKPFTNGKASETIEAEQTQEVIGKEQGGAEVVPLSPTKEIGKPEYKKGKGHLIGRESTETTPTGKKLKGRYKVVSADEVLASHNEKTFSQTEGFPVREDGTTPNDRDYAKDKDAQGEVIKIGNKLDSRAIKNTPIVSKDGIVLDGNNRTMSRKLAAEIGTDQEYLEALKDKAEMYGIDPALIDQVKNPMLVFETSEDLPYTTETFKMFNKPEKKEQSPIDKAVAISKTISDKAKRRIFNIWGEAKRMSDVTSNPKKVKEMIQAFQDEGILESNEIPRYFDSEKLTTTKEGVAFMETLLMGSALDENVIRALDNENMGDVRNKVILAIVPLVKNSTMGEHSLISELSEAIEIINGAKKSGQSIIDFVRQSDMFAEKKVDATAFVIADALQKPDFSKFIHNWNENVGKYEIFEQKTRTKQDAVRDYLKQNIGEKAESRLGLIFSSKEGSGGNDLTPGRDSGQAEEVAPEKKVKKKPEETPAEDRQPAEQRNTPDQPFDGRTVDQINNAKRKASGIYIKSIVRRLQNALPNFPSVVFNQEKFDKAWSKVNKNPDKAKPNGFTYKGRVYLNPESVRMDTPIHEFGHIWVNLLKHNFPGIYANGKKLIEGSAYHNQAIHDYPELSVEDQIDEAMAIGIGEMGVQIQGNRKGGFKGFLNNIWNAIKKAFGVKGKVNVETMTLSDFLNMGAKELLSNTAISQLSDLKLVETASLKFAVTKTIGQWKNIRIANKGKTFKTGTAIPFEAPQPSFFSDAMTAMQDKTRPVWELLQAIQKAGNDVIEALDIHGLMDLKTGRMKRKLELMHEKIWGKSTGLFGNNDIDKASVAYRLHKEGLGIPDLNFYMKVRHAKERNARVREQSIKKQNAEIERLQKLIDQAEADGKSATHIKGLQTRLDKVSNNKVEGFKIIEAGSGMTDAQADMFMGEINESEFGETLEEFAEEIRNTMIHPMIDILVKEGVWTEEFGQQMKDGKSDESSVVFENYIPLNVATFQFADNKMQGGKSTPKRPSKVVQKIIGTDAHPYYERVGAVEQLFFNFKDAVESAETNRITSRFGTLVEQNPNPDVWEIVKPKFIVETNEDGEKSFTPLPMRTKSGEAVLPENSLKFYRDGKPMYVVVKDERIIRAFTKNWMPKNRLAITLMSTITNTMAYFRLMLTGVNPDFFAANMFRDFGDAMINLGADAKDIKGIRRKVARGIPSALKAVIQYQKGHGKSNPWVQAYMEMQEQGGEIAWLHYENAAAELEKFNKLSDRFSERQTAGKIATYPVRKAWNALLLMNKAFEMGTRVSIYKNAVEAGVSPQKAALLAKNITVNFNKEGTWNPYISKIFLFINAGIQGETKAITSLYRSGKSRRTVAAFMLGLIANNFFWDWYDEDDEIMSKFTESERNTNILIFNPFNPNKPLKLPISYNLRGFTMIANRSYDVASGKRDIARSSVDVLEAMWQGVNPLDVSGNRIAAYSPFLLKPIVELAMNRNWMDVPITPERPWELPKRPSDNYTSSARGLSIEVAKLLSEVTRPSGHRDGLIEISPEVIDYSIDYLLGGFGKSVANAGDQVVSAVQGNPLDVNKVPVLRRFVTDLNKQDWRLTKYIYDKKEEALERILTENELYLTDKFMNEALAKGILSESQIYYMKRDINVGQKAIKEDKDPNAMIEALDIPNTPFKIDK